MLVLSPGSAAVNRREDDFFFDREPSGLFGYSASIIRRGLARRQRAREYVNERGKGAHHGAPREGAYGKS